MWGTVTFGVPGCRTANPKHEIPNTRSAPSLGIPVIRYSVIPAVSSFRAASALRSPGAPGRSRGLPLGARSYTFVRTNVQLRRTPCGYPPGDDRAHDAKRKGQMGMSAHVALVVWLRPRDQPGCGAY